MQTYFIHCLILSLFFSVWFSGEAFIASVNSPDGIRLLKADEVITVFSFDN